MNQQENVQGVILLECIAGQDRFSRIPVGRQSLIMAHSAWKPDFAVKELREQEGYMVFYAENGSIRFDGSNCHAQIFLNNTNARAGYLNPNDELRIGSSAWQMNSSSAPAIGVDLRKQFSNLIGLEELKDFRLSTIFSEVFKKHTRDEMEEQLITGTARNTPALSSIEVGWGRPWLFARLLGASVLLAFILYIGFDIFQNNNLVPGLIIFGCFAVPVSTLIFFLELNVPRNISIFMIIQFLFVGGVASLLIALVLFRNLDFMSSYLGASAAGIIEETAKLLVVIFLTRKTTRYHWILNGLLIGAAVGTGFEAFETAGYAFRVIVNNGVDIGVSNIMERALTAPFAHIIWTANAAAALWLVKKQKAFSWDMLQAPAFLRIMISVIVLHMLWNAPFVLMRLPLVGDLKYLVLGVLGWIICFRLVQAGIRQLNDEVQKEIQTTSTRF
jgi:RsiW-degrading membrane proteinase PrsW (M82 family)